MQTETHGAEHASKCEFDEVKLVQQELPKTDTQGEECAWKWEFACVPECTRDMLSDLEQALTSTHDDGT